MAAALSQPEWARQRPPIPFHVWLQLVTQAGPSTAPRCCAERRAFLDEQIEKETRALDALRNDPGPTQAVTVAIVSHAIEVCRLGRELLDAVEPMLR